MRFIDIFRLRLRSLFSRKNVEQELDEELRYHLERQIEEGLAAGMTPEEAHFAALRSIKGVEQRKEECRDMRGLNVLESVGQDFRYAIHQLRKNPGFAFTAIVVLTLGIGAAVTIFGFVDAALIKRLPYYEPSRLVGVFESTVHSSQSEVSYLDYLDWKKLNRVFRSIDAYAENGGFTLRTNSGTQLVAGTRVTAGFFRTLGVAPVLGRDFHSGENSPSAPETVLLSYSAWQKRFDGRRDVLGRTVTLNNAPHTIIGVLPRDFHFAPAGTAEFWGTLRVSGGTFGETNPCEQRRGCHNLEAIARLKNGVTVQAALVGMKSIARQLERQYPITNRDQGANVLLLRDVIISDVRPVLLLLLSAAGLLLLIACVNVISLLLARSDSRKREIAVRNALGASMGRLFCQFATESLLLAGTGCLLGLFFAEWSMRLLTSLIPTDMLDGMPYLQGLGLNGHVWAFTGAILVGASLLFAFTPTLRLSLAEMLNGLKEGSRGSAGNTWRRFGANLVVVELAVAVVLLVSAGLLGKSLYRLLQEDIGFRPDHLATLQIEEPESSYSKHPQQIALARQIVREIDSLPGVKSVGISSALPVSRQSTIWFRVVGQPDHGEHNER